MSATRPDIEKLFATVDKELGPVTALVNNAGVMGPVKPVAELGAAEVNALLQTNVTSMLLCAGEAIRRMSTQRGGKGGAIVNISSVAARTGGMVNNVVYAASKGPPTRSPSASPRKWRSKAFA